MLLVKETISKNPINEEVHTETRSILKLIGNGTSPLEKGYVLICDKSCKKPLCSNYTEEKGCTIKEKLIANWRTKNISK